MQLPPQSIDPNVPARIPDDQLQDFKSFLDVVLDTVVGAAAPDVHTLGLQLWGGLATVMVAWTGLKIAFSGTFEPWAIIKLVIGIAIPRTLLHYYIIPIPGVGLTFPAMVAGGGIWLQNLFISDVVSAGYTEMTALVQAYAAHLSGAWSSGNLLSIMTAGVSVIFSSFVTLFMGASLVFCLLALFCITYAQVIWAQVAIAIVILLGPVFIAFLLFKPLAFLFWGWFRSLMVYTLYGVVAGAVLRVFMGVGMGYITTYGQWMSTLRSYAFPSIGGKRVDHISPADVMGVLLPIWNEKHQTAKRVRQRISTVMRWGIAQGYRVDNPAGDAIGAALPKPPRVQKHYKALPYGEVAGAIEAVLGSEARATVKLGFEFLVLTACRSGEMRGARWAEIDIEGGEWTIPAERMKSRREHRVPLSGRAREILAGAKAHAPRSELVFPSARGLVLPSFEFAGLLKALGVGAVSHGFRSSFRDWAAERTDAPRAVMEAALAHAVRNRAEAAYARSDLFERRRVLMERWAEYLSGHTAGTGA